MQKELFFQKLYEILNKANIFEKYNRDCGLQITLKKSVSELLHKYI